MTTTPPPRPNINQPPAPLHGAKLDFGEPSSVRRSTRVSTKHSARTPSPAKQSSSPPSANFSSPRRTRRNNSSFTCSPPSSPSSPPTMSRTKRKSDHPLTAEATNGHNTLDAPKTVARTMLPTPAKTPVKKDAKPGLASAARVLFPKGPDPQEDPTPTRKRSRKHIAFSLDGAADEVQPADKIEIFTDSKEQVPTIDESADNPFYVKGRKKRGKKSDEGASQNTKVQDILERDKGMVYVFRGKKIYRRFEPDDTDQPPHGLESATEGLPLGELPSPRHFTRSSVKPRFLFPPPQHQPGDTTDEEATTEVDESVAQGAEGTPSKSNFHPATPPDTLMKKPRASAKAGFDDHTSPPEIEPPRFPGKKAKKLSPFQSWQRIKPGQVPLPSPSIKGKKRGADDLDEPVASKRVRSGPDLPR